MTTRDPRSSGVRRSSQGPGRDPTQSLSLGGDELVEVEAAEDDAAVAEHPSLALGTHDASSRDEHTRVASPQARSKPAATTPAPGSRPVTRPPPLPRAADDPEQRLGTMLGSYRVLEVLGKGGMGFVYRAEHVKLGREVALKLLRADYAQRKDAVARFIQEARTVNRVRHRNIVDVPDILELEDGTTCIVMEFLRGASLGKWARAGVDLPRALAVLVQICDGLSAAHAVGVVHRDLKPDNVIVVPTSDGAELVKLLDFGVAKLLNRDDEDVGFQTAAGSVIGTPAYMSPEQAGGMAIDARSDIYSLGAIMYELFCGQPMFRGRSFGEYVRKHLTEVPPPPRATAGGAHLDERIEAVILRCLEKDPSRRYPTILEVRDALLHLLGALETYPPTLGALAASGIRAGLPGVPHLPHHPTPGPGSVSRSGAHPSGAGLSASFDPSGYGQVSAAHEPIATPWWVWLVGGAVAVGLGVGAAVWYAGRGVAPTPAAAEELVATPGRAAVAGAVAEATSGPDTPAPAGVTRTLHFVPAPAGAAVYAEGSATALCQGECSYDVVIPAGEAPGRRRFVVRLDGHREAVLDVDLAAPQPRYPVTLEPLVAPAAAAAPAPGPAPGPRPRPRPRDAAPAPGPARRRPRAARDHPAGPDPAAPDPAAGRQEARRQGHEDRPDRHDRSLPLSTLSPRA